jgi:hypothetical protein
VSLVPKGIAGHGPAGQEVWFVSLFVLFLWSIDLMVKKLG